VWVKTKKSKPRRRLTGPIHARIAELRKEKGLTQEALASQLGIDSTAVSHWEKGFSRPDQGRLIDVATALGISVEDLIEGEEVAA